MVAFAGAVFQHVQFRYNFSQMDDLDNTTLDDNVSSQICSLNLVILVFARKQSII